MPEASMPSTADPMPEGSDELTSWVLHRLADPVIFDAFFKNLKRAVEAVPSENRFYVPTLTKLGALVFDLPTTAAHNDPTCDDSSDNSLCDDDLPTILPFLSTALLARYLQSDDPADLEESVRLGRKAAATIPPKHPFRSESLSSLSNALRYRFGKSDALTDLDEAIEAHRMTVEATPDGHPSKSQRLTALSHELAVRFELTSDEHALNEMVEVAELAERAATADTQRALKRSNWGYMLNRRFDWLGDLNDLQKAINLLHLAVKGLPDPHAERWRILSNLSFPHRARRAVAADQVLGVDLAAVSQDRRDAVPVLAEVAQPGPELDSHTEIGKSVPQQLLGAILRNEQGPGVRRGRARFFRRLQQFVDRRRAVVEPLVERSPEPTSGHRPPRDPEVVEDLHDARLHCLAAGAGKEFGGRVDDPYRNGRAR